MSLNLNLALAALLASPVVGQSFSFNAGDFSTFPQVPQTASINGFADPIYAQLPECAQNCVKESTGNTPCPYWDTGCLCIMPQWIDPVADCFAQNCKGTPASSASFLASSLCHSVGAWWGIGASDSTLLANAIADTTAAASATSSAAAATSTGGSSSTAAAPASTNSASSAAASPTSSSRTSAASSARSSVAAAQSSSGASAPSLNRNGAALTGVAAMGAVVAVIAHAL